MNTKQKIFLSIIFSIAAILCPAQEYVSKVWSPDLGNGKYKNPVIYADYSDPDVCQAGDDYYMTASSFGCVPGLPVLHSKDLVNWTIVSYALQELEPTVFFDKPQHGNGVYAPCIRYHNGEFYIYWGDPDFGIYVVKTKDPAGEWEKPVLVKSGKGLIDPSPLFDDDGKAYLVHAWAGSRSRINSVLTVSEMNPEGTKVVGKEIIVFDGLADRNHTVEGAKFYKRNGYYYIFAPAGGVKRGWQLALRSRHILGPYEQRVVLEQGTSPINGPHQGAWVDTKTGESWFLHFQDQEAYGRVIHLQPIEWINDWPEMGKEKNGKREPVLTYKKPDVGTVYPKINPIESDEFDKPELGLQWQWHANPKDPWAMPTNLGFLRLYAIPYPENYSNLWDVPNLLLQKFPAEEFMATTKLIFSAIGKEEKTGLLIMGLDYSYLSINHTIDGYTLSQVVCRNAEKKTEETIIASEPVQTNVVWLRVKVSKNAVCEFSYSTDGKKYVSIGKPFNARAGRWIGAKVGLFALNPNERGNLGYADFDWFRIEKE
ncbi:MAG: glycoside hydrolase 43 family protein [Tannerella sp.]|jgi:beta-xylosidase|nr:glycoside hydrolase 43 family protein [Tannerella sp.]